MRQKTIVYANTIDWDFPLQQRPHHLMKKFSECGDYKVYYVNKTQSKEKIRTRVNNNLEIYHNWEVFKNRVPEIDVFFYSWAKRHVDLDQIKSKLKIYDSLDNFPENENEEDVAVNKSDILLVTSDPLYQIRKNHHKNIHIVRNGCFPELGHKIHPIPEDLKKFKVHKTPIILFSGALTNSWCDLELVEKIAKNYTLCVVGMPWDLRVFPKKVHFLGTKTYDELQAYYQHCDVSILPFKRCQISDYSNPLKVYESLSHGKPTVVTDIPEMNFLSGHVLISKNHDEFLSNISKGLKLSKCYEYQDALKKEAELHSWDNRFEIIHQEIQKKFNSN